ncbi:MAG: pyridoxal phosphate-dependent aminotransferase [Parafannyhessea sp.]|uniref:pyridoxal phosphate-dependent aminotransferase n=1 Tax=Parafannyhessea sp. TaxID=2847324 RepID=UPI003F05FCA9
MSLELNDALGELKPSAIRRFSALAAQTPGCVSLTLGEPGEVTPASIRRCVSRSLDEGKTHYPPNNGTMALREAIAARCSNTGLLVDAQQVIVTNGATEALFSTLVALLNPGDEVIVPTPAFVLYQSIALLARARVVTLDTSEDGFQIDAGRLARLVTPRTKVIVLTSPNNPTGCVLDEKSLDAVAELASKRDFYVVCDDVYEELVYSDELRGHGFARLHPELSDRTVVVNSFSKPWAMTGWRLGWLTAAPEVVSQIAKVHQYAVSCEVSFTQDAAVTALATDTAPMRERYRARRAITLDALKRMGLPCVEPEGAFYAFPSTEGLCTSDEEFCERAIREAGVAVVPGSVFGCPGHVRISYATDDATLEEGLKRLAGFLRDLRG